MLIKGDTSLYFKQRVLLVNCLDCGKEFVVYEANFNGNADNCGDDIHFCPFCGCRYDRETKNE